MMEKSIGWFKIGLVALMGALLLVLVAGGGTAFAAADTSGPPNGATNGVGAAAAQVPPSQIGTGELSDSEAAGILFMREEEKLARDVYLTLYEEWGLGVFENIATSEATHMEAVKALIDRYGLQDPAAGMDIGEFTNPELQSLYNELVEMGSQSLVEALKVGAAIEEIDILDLQQHITETDNADVQRVYENLMQGSRNHLRAFTSTLERQGETYQPQYLDQGAFDEIVNAPRE
jgi:hypothetical protein